MVAFPTKDFIRGMKMLGMAFTDKKQDLGGVTRQIVDLAGLARRDGVLALEGKLAEIQDPFLKKALTYVVDGVDASVTRASLEAAIEAEHQENMVGAKVWEAAGGFAPTIGILGAVLGLIHVMENLSDPSKLGGGIATAFVATVYGVGSSNLLFLPVATKLKRKLGQAKERKMVITEGVLAIQEGLNPRVLEEKLRALTGDRGPARRRGREEGGLSRSHGRGHDAGSQGATMSKKKHEEEHENHERWLVSYADFMTLLFAFFVVMYSVSKVDNKKLSQAAESIKWAMHYGGSGGVGQLPLFDGPISEGGNVMGMAGGASARQQMEAMERIKKRVTHAVEAFVMQHTPESPQAVTILFEDQHVVVRLAAAEFFDAGQAALRPQILPLLDAVADELIAVERPIRVEGHTDDTPVAGSRFKDNWDLSAARAATVVSYLERAHGAPRTASPPPASPRPAPSPRAPAPRPASSTAAWSWCWSWRCSRSTRTSARRRG